MREKETEPLLKRDQTYVRPAVLITTLYVVGSNAKPELSLQASEPIDLL
jgi:hypothetical protein